MKKKKYILIFIVLIAIFTAVGITIMISITLDTAFLTKPNQAYENVDVIDGHNGISMKLSDKKKKSYLKNSNV